MARYLYLSIALLLIACIMVYMGEMWLVVLCIVALGGIIALLYDKLRRHKASVEVVLKAIENSDYGYRLSSSDGGVTREVLNRIKDIVLSARENVRASEAFLSEVLLHVPTGVVIIEGSGRVRYANEAALHLLSVPLLGHIRRLEHVYPELVATLSEMSHGDTAMQTISTDREHRKLSISVSEIQHMGEGLRVVVLSDIAGDLDRHETDAWIRLTRVLTHEIMNSIAPIRSISQALLSDDILLGEVAPSTREAIEAIYSTSGHLISFVDNYRRFSSVPHPQLSTISLMEQVQQAMALVRGEVIARSINLVLEGEDVIVEADAGLIHQVLHNLLRNALDATYQGGEIQIRLKSGHPRPVIEIYNAGEPIGEEVRAYIFIPFFTTKEQGSGIGLSLSRYIMRLHGGNLRYRPSVGGSIFVMEF